MIEALRAACFEAGLDFDALCQQCREVILFGSRAIEAPDAQDFDVMVITEHADELEHELVNLITTRTGRPVSTRGGLNFKLGSVDFVLVSVEQAATERWLGWELAGHVAHYGKWVHGEPGEWTQRTFVAEDALAFKEKRVASLWRAYCRTHKLLHSRARAKHRTNLRREIRRLRYLRKGLPVPPRTILDAGVKP